MNVKELIIELQKLPPDVEIRMRTTGSTIDTPVAYVQLDTNTFSAWQGLPDKKVVGLYE